MARKFRTIREESQVVTLYRDHSIRQIAQITGLNRRVVQVILGKYHIPMRGRGYYPEYHQSLHERYDRREWFHKLIRLYWDEGKTTTEIGRETGVPKNTIIRRMRSLGIAVRARGEYPCHTFRCHLTVKKKGEQYCWECRRDQSRLAA